MTTQQPQEKLQRYLNYLAQDKNNFNLLLSASDCYRQLGDWTSAQRYLDEAQQLTGRNFWTHQGFLYIDSNQMPLAKESFKQALAEEDTPVNRYNLAFCLYINHEFEEALALLNFSDKSQPLPECVRLKARLLHHLQRIDEAIMLLKQLLVDHDSDVEASGLLALLYFDNNNEEQAEFFSNKTRALDSSNYEGRLVQILLKTLRNEATVVEIESLLAIKPQDGRLLFALGTTQIRHMNFPEAEHAFLQTSEIWPYFYENWISYGWCHLLQNSLEKSYKAYRQAVEIDANSADGWGGLALVSALRGHVTQAETFLEKACVLDSDCFLAAITQIILANHSDPEQATKLFNTALPEVAAEIKKMISQAIFTLNTDEKIIH